MIYYWPNKNIDIEIWGIDLDKKSISVAQKIVPNGNFKVITLEKFKDFKEIGKFNIITFFEVLEHQDNPKEFLKSIYELLENNGFIFGSVPNRERLFVNLDRNFYSKNGDFPPNHFLYFNRKSLSILLKKVGFRDIKFYNNDFSLMDIGHYIAFCLSFGVLGKLKTQKIYKKSQQINNSNSTFFNVRKLLYTLLGIIFYKLYYNKPWHLIFSAKKEGSIL